MLKIRLDISRISSLAFFVLLSVLSVVNSTSGHLRQQQTHHNAHFNVHNESSDNTHFSAQAHHSMFYPRANVYNNADNSVSDGSSSSSASVKSPETGYHHHNSHDHTCADDHTYLANEVTDYQRYKPTYDSIVSKTYLINLDNRRDRLQYIAKRLHDINLPYDRFAAINFHHGEHPIAEAVAATRLHPCTKMNVTSIRAQLSKSADVHKNWGSTGCWQSHLQVYFDIADGTGARLPGPFLILEDDVDMIDDIHFYLSDTFLTQLVPNDWEMVYFSTCDLRCHHMLNASYYLEQKKAATSSTTKINYQISEVIEAPTYQKKAFKPMTSAEGICLLAFTYNTSGYLIRNQAVVAKLLAIANQHDVTIIDVILNPYFAQLDIVAYAVKMNPIWQRKSSASDIVYQSSKATKPQ